MASSYSSDLPGRVVAFVNGGGSRRAAARRFAVNDSFAICLAKQVAASGSLAPGRQGRPPGSGKLDAQASFLIGVVEAQSDVTMPELAARLRDERAVETAPAMLSRWLCRHGFTYKKALDGGGARTRRRSSHLDRAAPPRMRLEPHRLVFIDETAVTTNIMRLRGRRGTRLPATAPFGHWRTQSFIAGLRCHSLTAPWIVDGAMDRPAFDTWIETELAPMLARVKRLAPLGLRSTSKRPHEGRPRASGAALWARP